MVNCIAGLKVRVICVMFLAVKRLKVLERMLAQG
jgi:hypothetical protein